MANLLAAFLLLTILQGTRSQAPAGYEGCFADTNIFLRAFPHEEKWIALNTNARCVSHCRSRGYPYAGTEFTWQCFCGTEAEFNNLTPTSGCNSNCAGNANEKCGGSLKMSVYAVVALQNEIRLVGGGNGLEGRVEVRAVDTKDWGTVCGDDFDTEDATVACRMLGNGASKDVRDASSFGQGSGAIKMTNLGCSGDESSLFDCSFNRPGNHSCSHGDDVGIVCAAPPASDGLSTGAIIGIVFGVLGLLPTVFIVICVVACQSSTSSTRVAAATTVPTGAPTVVAASNMYYNTAQFQPAAAYPMYSQQAVPYPQPNQPVQQPLQAEPYPQPMPPQPAEPPYPQPSHPPPPPAYDEPGKPVYPQ